MYTFIWTLKEQTYHILPVKSREQRRKIIWLYQIDVGKLFYKIKPLFTTGTFNKLREELSQFDNEHLQITSFNGDKLGAFSQKLETKQISSFTSPDQYQTGSPC